MHANSVLVLIRDLEAEKQTASCLISRRSPLNPLLRIAYATVIGVGLGHLFILLLAGLFRVLSPLPLDGVELPITEHARRIWNGSPVYGPPTTEFVPLQYPPLLYWLAALLMPVTGAGYLPLRLISFLAEIGTLVVIFQFVRHETGSMQAAMIAASLCAAMFGATGWFALARVDALMVFLQMSGLYVVRQARSTRAAFVAGCLLGAASLAKQSAAVVTVAVVVWKGSHGWSQSACVALGVATALGAALVVQGQTLDWFLEYTVYMVLNYPPNFDPSALYRFLVRNFLQILPIASLLPSALLIPSLRRLGRDLKFFLFVGAGILLAALTSRVIQTSQQNALLPIYGLVAVLYGVTFDALVRAGRRTADRSVEVVLLGLTLTQLIILAYVPANLLPGANNLTYGAPVVRLTGPFTVPAYPAARFHWSASEPQTYADAHAVSDLMHAGSLDARRRLILDFQAVINGATPTSPVTVDERTLSAMAGLIFIPPPVRSPD